MNDLNEMAGIKVLIIEDSDTEYKLMSGALRNEFPEIEISRAETLAEAREKQAENDLLVLDLGLPDCNFFQILEFIRNCCCAVTIYSATTDQDVITATAQAGALCFVCKGTPAHQLAAGLLFTFSEFRRSNEQKRQRRQRIQDLRVRMRAVPLDVEA